MLNIIVLQSVSVDTAAFGHRELHESNGAKICLISLNTSLAIPDNANITLLLSGEAYLHHRFEREFNQGLNTRRKLSDFAYVRDNSFPSKSVQFRCDDFTEQDWSCAKKAQKCGTVLEAILGNVIIRKHTLQPHHKLDLISSLNRIKSLCLFSLQFSMKLEERKIICSGADRLFSLGFVHCQTFFRCVDVTLEALMVYQASTKDCLSEFGPPNNWSSVYGITKPPLRTEYFIKKLSMEVFPGHFLSQCMGRTPSVTIRTVNPRAMR